MFPTLVKEKEPSVSCALGAAIGLCTIAKQYSNKCPSLPYCGCTAGLVVHPGMCDTGKLRTGTGSHPSTSLSCWTEPQKSLSV